MGFVASGLIFKGLIGRFRLITGYFAITLWCKPLKIRPLQALGGILSEISSFEDQPEPPVTLLAIRYATYRALKDFAFEKRSLPDRDIEFIMQNSTSCMKKGI